MTETTAASRDFVNDRLAAFLLWRADARLGVEAEERW